MEHSYEKADARVRAIGGTSAEHLGSFVTWLGGQQYSVGYACIVARHALAFCRWCEGRGIDVEALTDNDIERFQRSRARRRSRRPETRRQERQALTLLLSEALNLKLADVDLKQAVLTIRGAKFGQWRLVPIHPSTSAILADYIERRAQFFHHPVSNHVFVSRRGTRLDGGHVHRTFYTLSRKTGLRAAGASKGPRLHDFRHRFAVQTLTRWYQEGNDPGRQMPLLST